MAPSAQRTAAPPADAETVVWQMPGPAADDVADAETAVWRLPARGGGQEEAEALRAPARAEGGQETAVWQMPPQAEAPRDQPASAALAPKTRRKTSSSLTAVAGLLAGLLLLVVGLVLLARSLGGQGFRDQTAPLALAGHAGHAGADAAVASTTTTTTTTTTIATATLAADIRPETGARTTALRGSTSVRSTTTPAPTTTRTTSIAAPPATSTPIPTASAGASTTAVQETTTGEANKCYNVYSSLKVNLLQEYPDNPDSDTFGFVNCKLCTNGTMRCTSLLHSGKSELIASHIHLASRDDGKDGADGEGPPVINFCGSDAQGLIRDGTDYTQPCSGWAHGTAHNADVPGALVANFNKGVTVAERVKDIAKRPHMYYFNFHSLASWNTWYPTPKGVCRGELVLQSVDP